MNKKRKWLKVPYILGTLASLATIIGFVWWAILPKDSEIKQQPISFPIHVSANCSWGSSPIYLQNNQKLHFSWFVLESGEVIVGFVTPEGEFFGFCEESNSLEKDRRTPLKEGSATIRPREYGWVTGFYLFRITACSQTTEIQVKYWID